MAAGDAPWTPHRCNQQCHRCALSRESCIQLEQNRPYLEQDRLSSSRARSVLANKDPETGGFKSLTENIDTTTSGGKLIFHLFGALVEFERDIIRERTNTGLEAARVRGKLGGRPKSLTPEKIKLARKLYTDKSTSVAGICKMLGISRHTLQRYVKE